MFNLTDLHGRLEQYEHRLQDAEDASQSKTTFLSRMSHEIRTPMNGIIGMLTLAKSRLSADNPAMQYLHKADELSDHLLSLINDILDMSRIEAGKVELEHKPAEAGRQTLRYVCQKPRSAGHPLRGRV